MDGYEEEDGGVMRESVSCKGGSLTRGRRKEGKWGQGINRDLTVCLGGGGQREGKTGCQEAMAYGPETRKVPPGRACPLRKCWGGCVKKEGS